MTDTTHNTEQPETTDRQFGTPETAGMNPAQHAAWRRKQADRRAKQQADSELHAIKSAYRRRWMTTPGADAKDFEAVWPDLLREHRREVASGRDPLADVVQTNPHADPAKWGLR